MGNKETVCALFECIDSGARVILRFYPIVYVFKFTFYIRVNFNKKIAVNTLNPPCQFVVFPLYFIKYLFNAIDHIFLILLY